MQRLMIAGGIAVLLTACATPPPAGSSAAVNAPELRVGDRWTYAIVNQYNHIARGEVTRTITALDGDAVHVSMTTADGHNAGQAVYTRHWGALSQTAPNGAGVRYTPALDALPFPLHAGQSWSQRVDARDANGRVRHMRIHGSVQGWETVQTPAGTFSALKVLRYENLGDDEWWRSETLRTEWDWYVPAIGWVARHEQWDEYWLILVSYDPHRRGDHTITELVSYNRRQDRTALPAPAR